MSEPAFEVSTSGSVVAVRGELDMATIEAVRDAVHDVPRPVTLHLTEVAFMDSSAVKLLDDLVRGPGPIFFRVPVSRAGRQVLEMTGMIDALPVEPS